MMRFPPGRTHSHVTAIGLVGALSVTCALLCGSTAAAAAAPAIRAVAVDNGEVWLATTTGLYQARAGARSDWQQWHRDKIDGRDDRPIDAIEMFDFEHRNRGHMLTVASKGVLWGLEPSRTSGKAGKWIELCSGNHACPRRITGLSVASGPDPTVADLVAFGGSGIWIFQRRGQSGAPWQPNAWQWRQLNKAKDGPFDVVAVAQDRTGRRIWAMGRHNGKPELRIFRPSTNQTTIRRLPPGWPSSKPRVGGAAEHSLMAPDATGGMWLGGDDGVLWMGVDARVHGEFRARPQDRLTLPGRGPFSVLSVNSSLNDILVGSSAGVARLSLGRTAGPSVSNALHVGKGGVVAMARAPAGGEVWVVTQHRLKHVWVDTWSQEPVPRNRDPTPEVTAMTAGGKGNSRVVVSLLPGGLKVAHWDPHDGRLEDWSPAPAPPNTPNLFKVTMRLSSVLPDGSVFFAPSKGLWLLNGKDGKGSKADEILAPSIKDVRVSAVEVVGGRLYVGTPDGLFSAPYDVKLGEVPETFEPVKGFKTADVTAIWGVGVHGRANPAWVGTSGKGPGGTSSLREVGRPVREPCGDVPPADAVVRSGAGTGPGSFVVVTSEGVYDARPYDGAADTAGSPCAKGNLRFQRQPTDDTNDAIPVTWFARSVGAQAKGRQRTRLVWAGADHGVDLIAFRGAFKSVPMNVVARFDSSTYFHANQVSAVATVGTHSNAALLVGTSGGIYAHRPALVPGAISVKVGSVVRYSDTGKRATACRLPTCGRTIRFPHTTRDLKVGLTVSSLGNSDLFRFIVKNNNGDPTLDGREFDLATGRGQTDDLRITALDPHLNRSAPLPLTLSVRSRTLAQWFQETNAKWVAALLAVAVLAAVSGFFVVRTIRRLGRKKLVDVELSLQPSEEGRTVVAFSGSTKETSVRLIDRPCAMELWDRLRSEKSSELVGAVGDVLYDGLFSHTASRALEGEGLGSRYIRLRLRGLDGELDALPWEALRTASGVLISRARISTVRDLRPPTNGSSDHERPDVDSVDFPVRVLVVVAAPNDLPPVVGADEEIGAIKKAASTRYRGRARGSVDVLDHATPDSLRAGIGHGYDFVHVIAHGERTGRGSRIWLEDVDGDKVRMESDELVDLFAGQERGVRQARLVLLNTCSSADGAESGPGEAASSLATTLVRRANVPAVVGMSMKIRTPAAVAFGSAFYRTLFRHGQVDHAMMVARREVSESDVDWIAPRLYIGSSEPELFGDE